MTNFHPDYFPMAKWESELCQNSFSQTFIRNFEVKEPNYNLTNINLLRSLSWIDRNFMFSIKIRFCIKEFTSFFSVFCIELNRHRLQKIWLSRQIAKWVQWNVTYMYVMVDVDGTYRYVYNILTLFLFLSVYWPLQRSQ